MRVPFYYCGAPTSPVSAASAPLHLFHFLQRRKHDDLARYPEAAPLARAAHEGLKSVLLLCGTGCASQWRRRWWLWGLVVGAVVLLCGRFPIITD